MPPKGFELAVQAIELPLGSTAPIYILQYMGNIIIHHNTMLSRYRILPYNFVTWQEKLNIAKDNKNVKRYKLLIAILFQYLCLPHPD